MRTDPQSKELSLGRFPRMVLMCKDTPVLSLDPENSVYDILNESLIPYTMKGRLRKMPDLTSAMNRSALLEWSVCDRANRTALTAWLAARTLPLSRKNAKHLYQLFAFEQMQDELSKAGIAVICRAVSLQDDYWLKLPGDTACWQTVSLRDNPLNEIVTQVALHGTSLTLQGDLTTPELSTNGAYAKAWIREADGLYLHKRGADGNSESRIEVECSRLLDKMNVAHIPYLPGEHNGVYTCKCKCMTTDQYSMLPALDFYTYCNGNGLDYEQEIRKIDAELIYKMWIVDYLISNRDRHGMNWGFFYRSDTMEIIGCHPLFDHNNSFDPDLMADPDTPYLFDSRMTMRQAARLAMSRVDFHFTAPITRADFLTDRHCSSFLSRAKELGIAVLS